MFRRSVPAFRFRDRYGQPSGWLRDRRGGVLTWAAFMIIPLLCFVGISIDSARGYMVRARLSQALDSAALAAGRAATDEDKATQEAELLFKANFPDGYMDAVVTGPTLTFSSDSDTVTVSATAVIPTYILQLVGQKTVQVAASSQVTRQTAYMDVVVSIDVSGSMADYVGSTQKIAAARSAASTLVGILFGSADTADLLKMGLVTWSANARILDIGTTYKTSGTTSKTVTKFTNPYTGSKQTKLYYAKNSPVPLLSSPPSGWTGCTRARYISSTNNADLSIGQVTVNGNAWMGWDPATETLNPTGGTKKNPTYSDMQCNNQGIQRLTNTKATILSAITGVKNPTGNTNMVMGLMWAWTVLAPKGTGSPFDADSTTAPDPSQGQLIRAIVLMTDGDNTQSDTDAYEGTFNQSQLDTRSLAAATAIKDAGVIIYTIRFGTDSNSEALLQQIASGPTAPYYQYAPTAADLESAFTEIGNSLSKLRLSR